MSLMTDCLALCTIYNYKRRAKYYVLANKYSELAIQRMFRQLAIEGMVSTGVVPEAELTSKGKQKLQSLVHKQIKEGKWTPDGEVAKKGDSHDEGISIVGIDSGANSSN